jgi:hypothetical protein
MNPSNQALIEKIFLEKQKEKSEDRDNLLRLTSHRLYGEKIHYALELIQNAEDEKSSSVTFIFSSNQAVIINDGRPFEEKDVWGICSVRPGGKKKKIGFFGIGFKSVFNITERPQIISDGFNFEVENYIYPIAKSSFPENLKDYFSMAKGAIFILPYVPSASPDELIRNFSMIDDKILLFLESLRQLKFVDDINNKSWEIKKNSQNTSVISLLNTGTAMESRWAAYHDDIQVEDPEIIPEGKEGIEKTRITIAFPLDQGVREATKKTGVAYCYLPTKKRTDLSFLIQADFLPTIGRENISEHNWNSWLMEKLGILAAQAIDKMKNDEQISPFLYEFIPLSEEVADAQVQILSKLLLKELGQRKIAKTTKGWVEATECLIPLDSRLRNILSETDLKLLFGKELFYIDSALSKRAETILLQLGAKPVGAKEVIDFLKKEEAIAKKTKEWFLNLYEYLSEVFDTTKKLYYGIFPWNWTEDTKALFRELQNTKFILTDDEKLVSLNDQNKPDRLICYPERLDLSEVHQLFTEGEVVFLNRYFQESTITRQKEENAETEAKKGLVKEWFDSIGVKKYFKQTHIIREVILPKFRTEKYKQYSDSKLFDLVDYIRNYWSTIESEINNKKISADVIDDIRSSIKLKTFSYQEAKKLDSYRNPREIYFSRRYGKNELMEDLFGGINDVSFLSAYYLNREKRQQKLKKKNRKKVEYSWKKFFDILGVWSSPRAVKQETWISISGVKGYDWLEKKYSPRGMHEIFGDSYSEDIEKLIEHCSKMNDTRAIQKRMRLLWYSLEKFWKVYKEKHCKTSYKWFYGSWQQPPDLETSSLLEYLRSAKWVPQSDGGFSKPGDMFFDSKKNRLLLGDDEKYVSLKADETFLQDLRVKLQPKIENVLEHLELYKERNPSPKENKIEKMNVIYDFLSKEINSLTEPESRNKRIMQIRQIFHKKELLYLPREDKTWWKPVNVFWKDYSSVFETLRGYVENQGTEIYSTVLKEFFSYLGVAERPLSQESLDFLSELKENGNSDLQKKIIPKVYTHLNEVTNQGLSKGINWDKGIFLSEKGHFLTPSKLFFNDNDEYKECFEDKVEILWLPYSWDNIKSLLKIASFKKLSENICVIKRLGRPEEIEGSASSQLISRIKIGENYLKKKNFEVFLEMQRKGAFNRIDELQAFETAEISIDYVLKLQNEENIVVGNLKKEAYFSTEENRLYKSSQTDLLSTYTAKEISKLFSPAEEYIFPFFDSLFSARNDEELNDKLRLFGLKILESSIRESPEKVKIIPHKEEEEQKQTTIEDEKPEKKTKEKGDEKPVPPESRGEPSKYDLVNVDDFVFSVKEEFAPYIKKDGPQIIPSKTIELKPGHQGETEKKHIPRERIGRSDAEAVALEFAMRLEEIEDREPEDRHKQPSIGYDIYSKTVIGEEFFVEVKHFRGEAGTWELTPHQFKKAEVEKDRYYVYVISRLKEGSTPMIEVIQNPVKYLTPEPPIQKKFSDWKNGVAKTVKFKKA